MILFLEPQHWAWKRKKREEIVESERAVGELARQAASYKRKFLLLLSSSLFWFFYFCSVLVRTSLFCTEKCCFPFKTVCERSTFPAVFVPDCRNTFFQNLISVARSLKSRKDPKLWSKPFFFCDWNQITELEKERREKKSAKVSGQLAGLPRQAASEN